VDQVSLVCQAVQHGITGPTAPLEVNTSAQQQ